MGVVQCQRGHFYDDRKFRSCPYCENHMGDNDSVTVSMKDEVISRAPVNVLMEDHKKYEGVYDAGKTVALFSKEKGNDFVTGWLVCISGPEKGRSWELHYGFNRLSRSTGPQVDISLEEDTLVTRDCHCSIVYEYNKNVFYLVPEEGYLVYLDDEFVSKAVEIHTGDIIKVGSSELEFVAFCREDRKWEK